MPKNTKGGNKAKSQKNSSGPKKNREIEVPETSDNSHVAVITKVLGDSRYTTDILSSTGVQKSGIISSLSSTVKKKQGSGIILKPGNYVLVTIPETDQGKKGHIIFLYRDSEISFLIENGYMPSENKGSVLQDIEFSDSCTTVNQDIKTTGITREKRANINQNEIDDVMNSFSSVKIDNEIIDYDAI